jgi:Arm DNA-binding domain
MTDRDISLRTQRGYDVAIENLSDAWCEAATGPAAGSKIYYDAAVRGFGLRVTKAGAKSFVLNYRVAGIERRYTIGTFRDPWKTVEARREAARLKKLIDQGWPRRASGMPNARHLPSMI